MSRQKRLEKAQVRVLFQVPFFAAAVARLPVTFDDSIPTACTDGKGIRWNGKWFDALPDEVLPTVLCHEACHCLLGHLWRAPVGVDWQQWNIATDHAVNLMLKEFSEVVMAKRVADPFPFPEPHDAYCADAQFKGMAEEAIYARLAQNKPKGGGGSQGKGQGGKASPGSTGAPGQGKGKGTAPGSMPDFGQMEQPQGASAQSEGKKLANDWDGTLVQSAQMAQGRRDCPASLQRLVDAIVDPVVPWQQVLRSLIVEQAADDWDFMKPAVEYCDESAGLILPSLNSEKMGTVVFATDSSGSTCNLIAAMQSEKQAVLDDLRPSKMVDIYCDAAVHDVFEYTPGDRVSKEVGGGGGTDFRPVWDHVAKMTETPKVIVYLTDMDGTFGEDPGVPVIWVTWTKDSKPPFGAVVYAPQ
jgi:Predicted metallopeptidase (DUF2201).